MLCVLIAIAIIVPVIIIVEVSEQEKQTYFERFGGDKAIDTPIHYVGSNITYNIYNLKYFKRNGKYCYDYYQQAIKAIDCADKAIGTYTDFSIKYTDEYEKNSNYTIKVVNNTIPASDDKCANARNNLNIFGPVSYSLIECSEPLMKLYSKDGILHLLLHEIGHTLGLKDLQNIDYVDEESEEESEEETTINSDYAKKSVMYYSYDLQSTTFTDYTDFDKRNLKYLYKTKLGY